MTCFSIASSPYDNPSRSTSVIARPWLLVSTTLVEKAKQKTNDTNHDALLQGASQIGHQVQTEKSLKLVVVVAHHRRFRRHHHLLFIELTPTPRLHPNGSGPRR